MLSGSSAAASSGFLITTVSAISTRATVQKCTPARAIPIAATGTSRPPQPTRRSSLRVIRHISMMKIHMLPSWPRSGLVRHGRAPNPW